MGRRVPLRTLILAAAPLVLGILALVAFGTVAGASAQQREVWPIIIGLAIVTSVLGIALPRAGARSGSISRSILLVGVAAMLVTGAAITLSTAVMLLPPPEVRVLVILLLYGAGLGIILELMLGERLIADLRRLHRTVRRLEGGDYGARAELNRTDELGDASRVIDSMATRLGAMERERAEQMASREAFLTAVGHDLRTPLAAMRAAVEALEDGLAPDPSRYHAAMKRDVDAMAGLVDDLFTLARLESGALDFQRVAVDLAELSDEQIEALTPVARARGVRVRLETPGEVYTVGGPSELSRAVRNLLDNAIRHAPPSTEVLVQVTDDGGPLVRVIDDGPGIPEEMRDNPFGGYMRHTEADGRTAGGAGLGLQIARRLVEAHGGRIWIEPGSGGRVCFQLPARQVPATGS